MKILIGLIILSLLGGCGEDYENYGVVPSDYNHASALCQPNGGLVEMRVTTRNYRAICVNGAEFYKAKGDE